MLSPESMRTKYVSGLVSEPAGIAARKLPSFQFFPGVVEFDAVIIEELIQGDPANAENAVAFGFGSKLPGQVFRYFR